MDRIDIQLRVQRITAAELRMSDDADRLTTVDARAQVVAARAKAAERLSDTPWRLNSQVPGAWFRTGNRRLSHTTTASLDRALERGGLTMRGYDRVLRLAWTVADLDSAEIPTPEHVGRALYLRKSIQQ